MKPVEFSDRARSDFLGLVEYLYAPRAAELIEAYESVLDDLRQHPDLGERWDERTRLLRRGGYRFYYVEEPDRIRVVRIIDPQSGQTSP